MNSYPSTVPHKLGINTEGSNTLFVTTAMFLLNLRILFIITIISKSITSLLVNSLEFNFPWFNETAEINITRQRDTFFGNQGIWLTKNDLTTNITRSTGRAVYEDKVLLWDSETSNLTNFSTHFSFSIDSLNVPHSGDGLTFFLLSNFSILAGYTGGGFLGIYTNRSAWSNTSIYSFVAIEIDTHKNPWDICHFDHVGINVNSYKSVANVCMDNSFKDGRTVNASVSYNSVTKNLSVLLTYDVGQLVSLWHVVDLREILPEKVNIGFSGSTGYRAETHKILSWNFTSDLVKMDSPGSQIEQKELTKKSRFGLIAGLVVAAAGAMIVVSALFLIIMKQRSARRLAMHEDSDNDESIDDSIEKEGGGPKKVAFSVLLAATNNFAKERKLGQGGFGEVYKGLLNGEEVAIKKVSAGSSQGKKEYLSEVRTISKLRHRNLVQLVGWCHKQGKFLLVYKFMPNSSLDFHLYSQKRCLAWPVRYKIALGLASALLYLHEEWEECVVHRDIKPSNVMLDSEFEAKLGDFGLARFVNHHENGSQTTILAGTRGYISPESVTHSRARKESDVYSFGVVALEIACGRKPVDPREEFDKVLLVEWVWELYGTSMILDAADMKLKMDFEEKEMKQLMVTGLWCAHPDLNLRPSIRQVINVLKFEAPLPLLPPSMPVPTYSEFPMDTRNTASSQGYESFTTNSSSISVSMSSPSTC